ncbi:MAG TPA: shikimate dehydrogenase [Acidimicrobiales bacterium]|nr:shikimate dehydrogenase [Acidimicrobiales bacterium]
MTALAGSGSSWPGASTRVAGVIGDPVRHSLSPRLHNAAFRALELDWVYLAFAVPAGGARAAIEGVRALGIDGLNVTMPHKADVAAAVDTLSPAATALGAVNTVVRSGSVLEGHNTDGDGFVASLRADDGFDPSGRRCLVLGSGGAARAVVRALAAAGASEVVVVARREEPAGVAAALAGAAGRVGSPDEVDGAELVVNATPVGMGQRVAGGPEEGERVVPIGEAHVDPALLPLDPGLLGPGQLVVDLVYEPLVTPLVAAARERGARAANGVGMLIHQAALSFRLWTREDAPLEAMSAAVLAHLAGAGHPERT